MLLTIADITQTLQQTFTADITQPNPNLFLIYHCAWQRTSFNVLTVCMTCVLFMSLNNFESYHSFSFRFTFPRLKHVEYVFEGS